MAAQNSFYAINVPLNGPCSSIAEMAYSDTLDKNGNTEYKRQRVRKLGIDEGQKQLSLLKFSEHKLRFSFPLEEPR